MGLAFMTTHSDPENAAAGRLIERRCEDRVPFRQVCTYELCEPVEGNKVAIHQGEVLSRNISSKGMLLGGIVKKCGNRKKAVASSRVTKPGRDHPGTTRRRHRHEGAEHRSWVIVKP